MKVTILRERYSVLLVTVIAALFCLGQSAPAGRVMTPKVSAESRIENAAASTGVYFEENRGQQNSRVKYMTRGGSHQVFLTATEAVYVLMPSPSEGPRTEIDPIEKLRGRSQQAPRPQRGTAVYMTLAGANANADFVPDFPLEHRTNYFIGNVESNWHTNVPNYHQITARGIYDGIDTVWHGNDQRELQYDFVVAPNADPSQIEWQIDGANSVSVDTNGSLVIDTDSGRLVQQKPLSFQDIAGQRSEIASSWQPGETLGRTFTVRFTVGNYDRTKPLTIDPSVNLGNLAFSTYLGGSGEEYSGKIEVDPSGNSYIVGSSESPNFPTTSGAFDTSLAGSDAFVTKISANGGSLVYSTFIGGQTADQATDIALDGTGSVYITGATDSTDFPGTLQGNAAETSAIITKLSPAGDELIYSYRFGGSNTDLGNGISVSAANEAFVTGFTDSPNFPTRPSSFDPTYNGGFDGFAFSLNSDGTGLRYSTYLGGSAADLTAGISTSPSGEAVITGYTSSTDFPVSPSAFDTTHNGLSDCFVTKLNYNGSGIIYSTYLGGVGDDGAYSVDVNQAGEVFITGQTNGTDFPTTNGSYDTTYNGGVDAFVAKLSSSGSGLLYSTFIGGQNLDRAWTIKVRPNDEAIIAGETWSPNFPLVPSAFDTSYNGNSDGMIAMLSASGANLSYGTFIGTSAGGNQELSRGIAVDDIGNIYVATDAPSSGFPTTPESFQPSFGGLIDTAISKFGDFSISGRALTTTGAAIPNTAIGMSGDGDGFQLTDAFGNFYFGDTLTTGTYLISATSPYYTYNPANYNIVTMNRNKRITFVGRSTGAPPAFADLGGKITSTAGNIGLPNTKLTLVDPTDPAAIRTATTSQTGNYIFNGVPKNRYYHVYAERPGFNFEPGDLGMAFIGENLDLQFTARPTSPRPVHDLDGDGKTDLVVYRASEGNWYIQDSQTGRMRVVRFGVEGDIPVADDYDGDRRTDIAVFRPSNGNWYWISSADEAFHVVHFGLSGDKPVPADYDGDRKADLAVYRPSEGMWYRLDSTTGAFSATQWGIATDRPVPADFDGDGKADLTVYRDGTWYRLGSETGVSIYQYGIAGDIPMGIDLDGDGWPESAVFRPLDGTWYWLGNRTGESHAMQFGTSMDIPVPADYDGDGRFEQAVYRNGVWYVANPDGTAVTSVFGIAGDQPTRAVR